jgi:hypothetical protein
VFALGRACASVEYQLDDEHEAMRRQYGTPQGRSREGSAEEARRRMELVRAAFAGEPPEDLLLATSPPLLRELADAAQRLQPRAPHLRPDSLLRQLAAHTWHHTAELSRRASGREYLVETAWLAEAGFLITPDPALQTRGGRQHRDERSGREAVAYALDDFVAAELPASLDFLAIDASAVLMAAVRPLPPASGPEEPGGSGPRRRSPWLG